MANDKPIALTSAQAQNALPAELRNEIYSALLSGTGIRSIEGTLTHEMQSSGFMSQLKSYITYLLRSGECTTFDQVMDKVKEKIMHDTHVAKSGGTNGVNGVNGHSKDSDDFQLRMPETVVTAGTKTVVAELDKICEITVMDDK